MIFLIDWQEFPILWFFGWSTVRAVVFFDDFGTRIIEILAHECFLPGQIANEFTRDFVNDIGQVIMMVNMDTMSCLLELCDQVDLSPECVAFPHDPAETLATNDNECRSVVFCFILALAILLFREFGILVCFREEESDYWEGDRPDRLVVISITLVVFTFAATREVLVCTFCYCGGD